MSTQSATPVDPASMSAANILVHQLGLLVSELLVAGRASANPNTVIQLNSEMLLVQGLLNQATQAQNCADDAAFAQVTRGLKAQATALSGMEAQVRGIVSDAGSAGRIIGYIGQAIALVGEL
jgi:hypothetical protein